MSVNLDSKVNGSANCPNPTFGCNVDQIIDFHTIGPKVGYVIDNNKLLYVSGGYTSAEVRTQTPRLATGIPFDQTSAHHSGWSLGAGFEYGINKHLSVGAEVTRTELRRNLHISPVLLESRELKPKFSSVSLHLNLRF